MASYSKGSERGDKKPDKPGAKKRDKPKRKQGPAGGKTGLRRPMAPPPMPPVGQPGPAMPLFGGGQVPPMGPMPGY